MHIEVDGQVVFDVPGQAGRSDLWSCTIAEIPGAEVDPLLTPRRLDRAQAADSVWERARRWRGHECLRGIAGVAERQRGRLAPIRAAYFLASDCSYRRSK